MKKYLTMIVCIMVMIVIIPACSKVEENKKVDIESREILYRKLVFDYYNEMISTSNGPGKESKEIIIFKELDYGENRMILAHCDHMDGQVGSNLFLLGKHNDNYEILKIAYGFEPISMGFSINRLVYGESTVLFGTFSESTWVIEDDSRRPVNYTSLETYFHDGTSVDEYLNHSKGYIIIAETISEVKDFILYNNEEIESNMEYLVKYGIVINEVEFIDFTKNR